MDLCVAEESDWYRSKRVEWEGAALRDEGINYEWEASDGRRRYNEDNLFNLARQKERFLFFIVGISLTFPSGKKKDR